MLLLTASLRMKLLKREPHRPVGRRHFACPCVGHPVVPEALCHERTSCCQSMPCVCPTETSRVAAAFRRAVTGGQASAPSLACECSVNVSPFDFFLIPLASLSSS